MKGLLRIWQMAQSGVEYDEVKGRIRERNGSTVSGAEGQLWMALPELSRPLHENRRRVDSDHFANATHLGKNSGYRAGSAADIQHDCCARKLYLR